MPAGLATFMIVSREDVPLYEAAGPWKPLELSNFSPPKTLYQVKCVPETTSFIRIALGTGPVGSAGLGRGGGRGETC